MRKYIAFWSILMRDMKTYYLKPTNISWGIIFPFAWTLMFFLRSESAVDIREILPGVMSLAVLFGTTSMLAVTITFERRSRSFERLLLAPISLNLLMLTKTSGAIIFGILNALLPVIIASLAIDLSGIDWFKAIFSIIFIAITSAFLGLFISVSDSEVFEAQTFSNFVRFPMMFLCGLFIPLERLPLFLRPLSYVLPLTYGVDVLKTSINGKGIIPSRISFLMLISFSLFFFLMSINNIQRKWIY